MMLQNIIIYTWVYFLKTKDEVFAKFVEWKTLVEKQFDKCVKIILSDNGGEYTKEYILVIYILFDAINEWYRLLIQFVIFLK